jgi:hypothetical protein
MHPKITIPPLTLLARGRLLSIERSLPSLRRWAEDAGFGPEEKERFAGPTLATARHLRKTLSALRAAEKEFEEARFFFFGGKFFSAGAT